MLQLELMWGCIGGFDILSMPHYRAFEMRVCQIPTIAPYNPEGGLVGQYIDRCITTEGLGANQWIALS